MKYKDLSLFLFIQILTVPIVIAIFKLIDPRNVAGIVAGVIFISVGVFFIFKCIKWPQFYKSPVFYLAAVHLLVIALPMFFTRILNFNTPFEELKIIGLAAPEFHKLSEKVFGALMISTVLEHFYLRAVVRKKKQEPKG